MLSALPTPKRLPGARRIGTAALAAALSVSAGAAASAAPAADPDIAGLQRWIEESVSAAWTADRSAGTGTRGAGTQPETAPLRVEVRVGSLGARPRLPACSRVEPFLPPNARLWGPSHIGVRCAEGGSWSMMVPVTVSVYGPALVADRPLAAGAGADPESFRIDQVDLTRARGAPVADPALLAGRTLARSLSAGEVLRTQDLRVPQTVAAGDPVRIRLLGQGFTVSSDGFALAGAGEGQPLRVRTSAGKMLVGTVRARVVEVRL